MKTSGDILDDDDVINRDSWISKSIVITQTVYE